jgi:hypothetical protein
MHDAGASASAGGERPHHSFEGYRRLVTLAKTKSRDFHSTPAGLNALDRGIFGCTFRILGIGARAAPPRLILFMKFYPLHYKPFMNFFQL